MNTGKNKNIKIMSLNELKQKILANKEFKNKFEIKDETELAIRVGGRVQELRLFFGWTQAELAEKMNTQQPNVARIESGKSLPSLSTLHNIAKAADTYLVEPTFACLEERNASQIANLMGRIEKLEFHVSQAKTTQTIIFEPVPMNSSRFIPVNEMI